MAHGLDAAAKRTDRAQLRPADRVRQAAPSEARAHKLRSSVRPARSSCYIQTN